MGLSAYPFLLWDHVSPLPLYGEDRCSNGAPVRAQAFRRELERFPRTLHGLQDELPIRAARRGRKLERPPILTDGLEWSGWVWPSKPEDQGF